MCNEYDQNMSFYELSPEELDLIEEESVYTVSPKFSDSSLKTPSGLKLNYFILERSNTSSGFSFNSILCWNLFKLFRFIFLIFKATKAPLVSSIRYCFTKVVKTATL